MVLCAVDARQRGATVLTRWRCERARVEGAQWVVELSGPDGAARTVRAGALVNATGPWASSFLHRQLGEAPAQALRLVKGSHIVVPRLFEHDHAYIFQNADRRIIFAIPYEGAFTLIGTTDVECHGDPGQAHPDAQEVAYLCEQASRYFAQPVLPASVVWSYSGVRPLLDDETGDPSAVTRDYQLDMKTAPAPLLSVWGGKITTFRKLAEQAADQLCNALQVRAAPWTARALLPGGDLSRLDRAERPPRCRHRTLPARAVGAPARADDRVVPPLVAQLRFAGATAARRPGRSRRRGGTWVTRGRAALPVGPRMGPRRRRRVVATQQARPAPERKGTRRVARWFDDRADATRSSSIRLSAN